jgi:hypothetical protein
VTRPVENVSVKKHLMGVDVTNVHEDTMHTLTVWPVSARNQVQPATSVKIEQDSVPVKLIMLVRTVNAVQQASTSTRSV